MMQTESRVLFVALAILNLQSAVESKLLAKYAPAYVDASSWTGEQTRAIDGLV